MRRRWLAVAVAGVACAVGVAVWVGRGASRREERSAAACTFGRDAVYAFVGLGEDFRTAVVDVAHPDTPCVDRRLPRDARQVGVRGSDGALLYLAGGRLFRAAPETATWSAMHKAWTFPRETPPDAEVEAPKCARDVEGFLTAPDSDRLVYWCPSRPGFHDTEGPDLPVDAKRGERPVALGFGRTALARRGMGSEALLVLGPVGSKIEAKGLDLKFSRARLPVRATREGFLVLLPKGLEHEHQLFRVDREGRAAEDQRFEDVPDLEIGSLDVVIDEDGGIHAQTRRAADGVEVVIRIPPGGKVPEIVFKPAGGQRFAASNLFTAP
jgi:hypothetical protein